MAPKTPTPLIFVSHGSTMMLGEQSVVSDDWERQGRNAERRGIKGVVILGAHWEFPGENLVHISIKKDPGMNPIAWVAPEKYINYKINCDEKLGRRVGKILEDGGVNVKYDTKEDWVHDSLIPLKWMFPKKCPPVTLISVNTKYDPTFHASIGRLLSPLRDADILLLGTGGAVHNLYRNQWPNIIYYKNNFAQATPPREWALGFRQAFVDVFTKSPEASDDQERAKMGSLGGTAEVRDGATRLMHHPLFREAHGTDDHYMSACFIAGAARPGELGMRTSEVWELENMCNAQFQIGEW